MTDYTITVTQEDIDYGCRRSGDNCPIAKAAFRVLELPEGYTLCVEPAMVYVDNFNSLEDEYVERRFSLPEEARLFIDKFDEGRHVEPFSFTMEEV